MAKLIAALHGPDAAERLLGDGRWRDDLRATGATAVQVNVDDAAVAPALRFGPGQRITALVSVWTDGSADETVAIIAAASGDSDVHAYAVSERVRLDPEPTADGARSDVLAQVALLRRPETMTRDDYLSYWMLQHTPIAIRTQNTSAYIQNIVDSVLTPGTPAVAAIVEEHFPMLAMSDPHEFYGSRGDDAQLSQRMGELMASVARFGADQGLDLVPTSRYVWRLTDQLAAAANE